MKIHEAAQLALGAAPYEIVKALKNRSFPEVKLRDILKEINIDLHDIMSPTLRPDKKIYKAKKKPKGVPYQGNIGPADELNEPELDRIEPVNRIALSYQELICNKRVSFCLANPAIRTYKGLTDKNKESLKNDLAAFQFALERVLFDNKIVTHDRELARNIFTYCEVAEYWYLEDLKENSDRYGFTAKERLKVAMFSRENGEKFYPLKDRLGDFICFSREYQVQEGSKKVTYFQVFTDEEIGVYKQITAASYEQISFHSHELGKMPIVFGWQRWPEYRVASRAIKRLEVLLSNHAEVNDYHSAPKILLTHAEHITGFGEKGSSSMLIQAKGQADAKYLTWDHATDSVKLEIETLLNTIYSLTQTPNINFDNLKNFGAVSGVAIKLLFMDTHLAVKDKESILLDIFQRRTSIQQSLLAKINVKMKAIIDVAEVNHALDPFMIADDKEKAEILMQLNGGQIVKSQLTSVIEAGGDTEEYDLIIKETKDRQIVDVTEPTF